MSKKKFQNAAEKQRNWRQNNAIKKALAAQSGEPLKKSFRKTQTQWNSRNGYHEVEKGKLENDAGEVFLLTRLIPDTRELSENDHLIFIRHNVPVENDSISYKSYTSALAAKEEFLKLIQVNRIPEEWKNVDNYIAQAQNAIIHLDKNANTKVMIPNRLAFFFAMAEMIENGWGDNEFKKEGTKEKKDEDYKNRLKNDRRRIINEIGNFEINPTANHDELTKVFEKIFKDIGARENTFKKGEATTVDYFQDKCKRVISSISLIGSKYSVAFPAFRGIWDDFIDLMDEVTEYFLDDDDDETACLKEVRNYPPIKNLEDIKKILDYAWNMSIGTYNSVVLELTTLLRPSEAQRLISNRERYLLADGTLNYKGEQLPKQQWLVQKKSRDITTAIDLENPKISLIGRMILLHPDKDYGILGYAQKDFFEKKPKRYRWNPELMPFHHRCLRTTGAVMFAYNEKSRVGPATRMEAKERMGHKTTKMIDTVYIRFYPSHKRPENFFKIKGYIRHEGFPVTRHSSLWDSWLFLDFLDRYLEKYSHDQLKIEEFWKDIMKEAYAFQEIHDDLPEEEDIIR